MSGQAQSSVQAKTRRKKCPKWTRKAVREAPHAYRKGKDSCLPAVLETELSPPNFSPAAPILRRDAFDNADYLFELKMDGFRALAHVGADETRLVSRRGSVYKSFAELAAAIHIELDCQAVLDGEIVILDDEGRPQFHELLRRRGCRAPVFYAFDLLWLNGEDLRARPLIERKTLLRRVIPPQPSVLLYADHIEQAGLKFFRLTCERDLEGIVAKLRHGRYGDAWYKIRNPNYSQRKGRRELFEKRRGLEPNIISK
jgi:bifunctional non-homologous end joining protein LigD